MVQKSVENPNFFIKTFICKLSVRQLQIDAIFVCMAPSHQIVPSEFGRLYFALSKWRRRESHGLSSLNLCGK